MPPGRSIVVEDAPAGIEAARRASAPHPADLVVRSLGDLPSDAFSRQLAD